MCHMCEYMHSLLSGKYIHVFCMCMCMCAFLCVSTTYLCTCNMLIFKSQYLLPKHVFERHMSWHYMDVVKDVILWVYYIFISLRMHFLWWICYIYLAILSIKEVWQVFFMHLWLKFVLWKRHQSFPVSIFYTILQHLSVYVFKLEFSGILLQLLFSCLVKQSGIQVCL